MLIEWQKKISVHQQFPTQHISHHIQCGHKISSKNMIWQLHSHYHGFIVLLKKVYMGCMMGKIKMAIMASDKWYRVGKDSDSFMCSFQCQSCLGHGPWSGHLQFLQMVQHPWRNGPAATSWRASRLALPLITFTLEQDLRFPGSNTWLLRVHPKQSNCPRLPIGRHTGPLGPLTKEPLGMPTKRLKRVLSQWPFPRPLIVSMLYGSSVYWSLIYLILHMNSAPAYRLKSWELN